MSEVMAGYVLLMVALAVVLRYSIGQYLNDGANGDGEFLSMEGAHIRRENAFMAAALSMVTTAPKQWGDDLPD